jgi:HlyD family secretion protein
MKKKGLIAILIIIVLAIGGYQIVKSTVGKSSVEYQFAAISRGDLETTISATGTLTPLVMIDVGTQVSGTIDTVMVDFNDTVTAGQILAVLDTTVLSSTVLDAEVNVEKCEALLEQADYNYRLNKSLYNKGMISEADSVPTAASYKTQVASLKSAQVALDRARRNLEYAVIRSPISGIVIEKSTESGQTVAASFSTPTLFVIAQDLSRMEILAEVDESDIGQIKNGQNVRFEVATYSNKEFTGVVKQIRLQPQTVSNVVTYTVVVEANNDEGFLLPGMTATIDFITDRRTDVLLVPAKALRFQPSESQLEAFRDSRRQQAETHRNSAPPLAGDSTSARPGFPPGAPGQGDSTMTQNMSVAWYIDSLGQIAAAPLRTGMTDGTNTEILASRELTEGMKVITGTGTDATAQKKTTSTFQGPGGPGGPPAGL